MPETIAQMWESYRRAVVPRDAPDVQIQETRRAFYAGCQAFFAECSKPGVELPHYHAWQNELQEFCANVRADRA